MATLSAPGAGIIQMDTPTMPIRALSPGEFRALLAVARYESPEEAAKHLGVTTVTIKNQVARAYRKLGVGNRTAAYEKLGWLRLPPEPPGPHPPDAEEVHRPRRSRKK